MRLRKLPACLVAAASIALLAPATSRAAEPVSVSASATARLVERAGSGSWRVEVSWSAQCLGVGAHGATFQGNLYMLDLEMGTRFYLGLVSGPGAEMHNVSSRKQPRTIAFELQISCYDNQTLQGSDSRTVSSNPVLIPALDGDAGDGSGGGHSGGGGSGGGDSDATEPLGNGGCGPVVMGTTQDDTLNGGSAGEVIFGLGGDDRINGRAGHDCLIGGPGADLLRGQAGRDRLTGGRGRDKLYGGPGVNAYSAGPGADYIDSFNHRRETVRCGSGRDRARVDDEDVTQSCESVRRLK